MIHSVREGVGLTFIKVITFYKVMAMHYFFLVMILLCISSISLSSFGKNIMPKFMNKWQYNALLNNVVRPKPNINILITITRPKVTDKSFFPFLHIKIWRFITEFGCSTTYRLLKISLGQNQIKYITKRKKKFFPGDCLIDIDKVF